MRNLNHVTYTSLVLASFFWGSIANANEEKRNITIEEDVSNVELIKLDVPAGEATVIGTNGSMLTAEINATCRKKNDESCEELIKSLSWVKTVASNLELGLNPSSMTSYNNIDIHVKFGVPKNKKLAVSLGAGELHIDGTSACLSASVNAGAIKITLDKTLDASMALSSLVGDAKLITSEGTQEGSRSLLIGASLERKGAGPCLIEAKVMAGEVQLTLK